jgi:non-canonical (house-cleaning) NTP pyrophosphatase
VVAAVAGKVERLRGSDWSTVAVGDRVKAEDSLRTASSGRADLEIGDRSRLTVAGDTQVKIAELTAAVHRFKIRRGRVAAAYQPDGERVLRIERESGDAIAEARAASFSVRATDTTFAVATETGMVNLRAAGKAVDVAAGQLSVAQTEHAPSPAAPIPTAILLKVAAAAHSDPCSGVEGVASPGAEVLVQGRPATVGANGHFKVKVDDKDAHEVRVEVRDVSGLSREESLACAPKKPDQQSIDQLKIRWKE